MVLFGVLAVYTNDKWYLVRGRGGEYMVVNIFLAGREKFTYDIPGMNPYFIFLLQQRKVMDKVVAF